MPGPQVGVDMWNFLDWLIYLDLDYWTVGILDYCESVE